MNCECGVPAFFYTTLKSDNIKYEVFKCGTLASESKKGKCSLNIERAIKKIVPIHIDTPDLTKCLIRTKHIEDFKSEIIENLERYIHLLEKSQNNYGMSRDNYISNINYNLRRLNFPLFFLKKESVTSLKSRIYNIYIKKPVRKNNFPIVIIEMPENFRIISKGLKTGCKISNSSPTIKPGFKKVPLNSKLYSLNIKEEEILNSIKRMEIKSDSESETDDEDHSFDVDNCDSEDNEVYDDGGGLSD
jgi:hypothetical protein